MRLTLGTAILVLAITLGPAASQTQAPSQSSVTLPKPSVSEKQSGKCEEGKTASGECVGPHLGQSMRHRSIVFSQPKLSYTGVPTTGATQDSNYAVTRDRQQNLSYETRGSSSPAQPSSGTFIPLPSGVNPATLHLGVPYTIVPGGIQTR